MVARGGSDVEDRASSAGHHLLDRAGGQVDDGLDVDPHLGDLVVDRRFRHRPDGADAGVVDQDVGGQPATVDLVEEAGASGGIRDVAGDHLDADAAREFVGQLAQPVFAAGDERDAVAAIGQLAGDVGADARRCPGDDGGAGGRWSRKSHSVDPTGAECARACAHDGLWRGRTCS